MAPGIKCSLWFLLALAAGCCAMKMEKEKILFSSPKFRFDYMWSEQAGGWLKYHAVPATWDKARLRCHAEGAILASPLTDQLKSAVVSFVQKQRNSNHEQGVTIFSGVHSIFSEGVYTSIEGVPLPRLAITWELGEPDNYDNSERCLAMLIGDAGAMADVHCAKVLPYVCYKNYAKLIMTECGTTDSAYQLEPRTGSCYKFHKNRLPWSEAYMTCAAEGGYLAIINNDVEAEVMRDKYTSTATKYLTYVGFHDWGQYGSSFRTIHGEPLEENYYKWFKLEPNNGTFEGSHRRGEYCGSVYKDATLNDCFCDSREPFLCEKNPNSLL